MADGADMVELRLDALRPGETGRALFAERLPAGRWLATCRPVSEGGMSRGGIEHRVPELVSALHAGAGYVDFEFSDWQRSALARDELTRGLSHPAVVGHAPGLLISQHDFGCRPADPASLIAEMCEVEQAKAIKVVWPAEDINSNFDAFDMIRAATKDATVICTGEAGLLSRVLAPKLRAFGSFCAVDADSRAAPGQLTLEEMRSRFRWDAINDATELYGVIGHPVAHSISPQVFNDAFAAANVNAVYLPLLVAPTYETFAAFMDGCLARDWLDARGFSVTLPHKVHALTYLGDRVDSPADAIGAVNTIRIEDGEVWGCNTDCDAAMETLVHGLQAGETDLEGVPVDVLGAGGVAHAIVAGLTGSGCSVTIYNRDLDRARALAERFEGEFLPWEERGNAGGKILINCTSVGMWPDVDASPMPADGLRPDTVVFDTIYRPQGTRLLRDAAGVGCKTIRGVTMFVLQAAMQFEYWHQQPADYQQIAAAVEEALATEETT